jgi:hypothetical protein
MSLGLETQCQKRLAEKLAEELPNVNVENRMFLEYHSALELLSLEQVLPQTGPLKVRIEQCISETPVFDFLHGTLSRELYEKQKYDPETPLMKLTELEEYRDPVSVAQRLVGEFESLPWEYSLSIKLENEFGSLFNQAIKEYSVSDLIKLGIPDDDFIEKFPLQSGIGARDISSMVGVPGLLPSLTPQQWDRESTYLQVKVKGFIGKYGLSAPLENTIFLLKAFCGIAIALRLFKVEHTYLPTPSRAKFFIHRKVENAWLFEKVHELEQSVSDTFSYLVLHDLEGRLDTKEKKISWMQRQLELIRCVFSHQEKSPKIILGGQWLFDSYCGRNHLLSFVQTMVVVEILLGEKATSDLMGLGELLRNRCAYLIGKSHEQRENILNDFKEIYEVRSKIVHRGKNQLDMSEHFLFSRLQWMCRRVIQEEVDLLQADVKKNAKQRH